MRMLLCLGIVGLALLGMTGASPDTDMVWRPEGSYWETYGTVIVKAVCDSTGRVRQAEVVWSAASPAEADSVLSVVKKARYDPTISDGRIRKGQYERSPNVPDLQFIVPYAIRNKNAPINPLVTRKELEQAGLGPWLEIWDRLLPDWPVESWRNVGTGEYYEYTSTINDSQMVSLGMVSISPDKRWRLHPFAGVHLSKDGRPEFDGHGGFVLWEVGDSVNVRQHITSTPYHSAEWIDEHRFVVTVNESIQLDYGGRMTLYRAPGLVLGDVRNSTFNWIDGPPVPVEASVELRNNLDQYRKHRYPKFFNLLR